MSGRLGALDLAAGVDTAFATFTGDATINISACNRNLTPVNISIAIVDGALGDLSNEDYIAFDKTIPGKGQYEHTGIACSSGETVVVRSDTSGVSVRLHGFDD